MITKTIQIQEVTIDDLTERIAEKLLTKIDIYIKEYATKNDDTLLTRQETVDFLKVDQSTLWNWTKKGYLISYRIGSRVYYKKIEIINYLNKYRSV